MFSSTTLLRTHFCQSHKFERNCSWLLGQLRRYKPYINTSHRYLTCTLLLIFAGTFQLWTKSNKKNANFTRRYMHIYVCMSPSVSKFITVTYTTKNTNIPELFINSLVTKVTNVPQLIQLHKTCQKCFTLQKYPILLLIKYRIQTRTSRKLT